MVPPISWGVPCLPHARTHVGGSWVEACAPLLWQNGILSARCAGLDGPLPSVLDTATCDLSAGVKQYYSQLQCQTMSASTPRE